jgi:DNA-binding XRE family transcriptional regulator
VILTLESLHMFAEAEGQCLLWKFALNNYGYPQARIEGKTRQVRPYVYTVLMAKPMTPGRLVSARCENKACISPLCLVQRTRSVCCSIPYRNGTRNPLSEYVQRKNKAVAQGWSKLSMADVAEIRAAEGVTDTELAKRFGVHRTTAANARRGVTWKHSAAMNSVFNLAQAA